MATLLRSPGTDPASPAPSPAPTPSRSRRRWRWLPFSPWHLLLMPVALVFVLPLVQMVLTSFMSDAEINRFPPRLIPTSLHIAGYVGVLTDAPILRWLLNTVIVSTISIVAHLVLCSMAGYGFARLKFPGRSFGFFAIVATIMIPPQLLMIPTYLMFARLGVLDTLAAAFVPWLASAFGIFLMRQFFSPCPGSWRTPPASTAAPPSASSGGSCSRWPSRPWPRWPSSPCSAPGTTWCGR
jgi:ABC-type glycerol-3-phosphate transport system permease component